MKRLFLVAACSVLASGAAFAQSNCSKIGTQLICDGQGAPGGGYNANRIGNSTFYNYNDPQQARRQGMPSTSTDVGSTRFYDNGVTRQRIGNTDIYSNGVTSNRVGNTTIYSNGTSCTTIGSQVFCN